MDYHRHAGILSQIGLDVVAILTFINGKTTPAGYVPAVKRTRKSKTRLDNLKGNNFSKIGPAEQLQIGCGVCLKCGAGFDNF